MYQIRKMIRDLFCYDRKQLKKECEELEKRKAQLDPDSFENTFLKKYFITREELKRRMRFEDEYHFSFRQLSAKLDGLYLMRTLKRQIEIDFSIVSFKELFTGRHPDAFEQILIDQDEEVRKLKKGTDLKIDARVEFVYGDEEEGVIGYLIGIYGEYCISDHIPIYKKRCRLVDIGEEDLSRSISYCSIDEGVLLRKAGKRIVCSIDHVSIDAYITRKESHDLMRYLEDEKYLVIAGICEIVKEYPYGLFIEVSVYENPLK